MRSLLFSVALVALLSFSSVDASVSVLSYSSSTDCTGSFVKAAEYSTCTRQDIPANGNDPASTIYVTAVSCSAQEATLSYYSDDQCTTFVANNTAPTTCQSQDSSSSFKYVCGSAIVSSSTGGNSAAVSSSSSSSSSSSAGVVSSSSGSANGVTSSSSSSTGSRQNGGVVTVIGYSGKNCTGTRSKVTEFSTCTRYNTNSAPVFLTSRSCSASGVSYSIFSDDKCATEVRQNEDPLGCQNEESAGSPYASAEYVCGSVDFGSASTVAVSAVLMAALAVIAL